MHSITKSRSWRSYLPLLPLAVIAGAASGSGGASAPSLTIQSTTPIANILPREGGRTEIYLSALQYSFGLEPSCTVGTALQAVSLAVADTRVSLGAEKLRANERILVELLVPAKQIGPVIAEDFCTVDGATTPDTPLTLPSVLSAQAALKCASATTEQTIYASKPLDVTLICNRNQTNASE